MVGVYPGVRLRGCAHPSGGVVCRGAGAVLCFCSPPSAFAPGSSETEVEFLVSLYL